MAHRQSTDKVEAMANHPAPEASVRNGNGHRARRHDATPRPDGQRAHQALSTLSDLHRQAFVLAYFGECSQGEVARILGVPVGTVTNRIRNGLVGLRNELGVGT
jgi:RNA polymerase sigma-70 factor (ECF subfamily)